MRDTRKSSAGLTAVVDDGASTDHAVVAFVEQPPGMRLFLGHTRPLSSVQVVILGL